MTIDWTKVQPALTRAGFPCGAPDGDDGPKTYTALFGFAAGRQPDVAIVALGRAGAAWLKGDPITQTPERLAEFVGQTAHETGGYRLFEENLNYSADALRKSWPDRFPTGAAAQALAGKPRSIAEVVYGGRMGNDRPGDGWRYRGRGMLQLTGRANYEHFGTVIGIDLVAGPDRAADPYNSLVIAREFWRKGRVNDAVDKRDFVKARRITNGGRIGLEDVAARRARLLTVLAP